MKNLEWVREINKDTALILTDDMDSLLSCFIIGEQTGAQIRRYHCFNYMYTKELDLPTNNFVGVDLDLAVGKCFSNHVTPYNNPQCYGFNQAIDTSGNNYRKKFAGSTVITLLWHYGYDFSKFTEEQIKFFISIDVAYKQYYSYRDTWNMWYNDFMKIGKYIEPVLEKYTLEEMNTYMYGLGLSDTININRLTNKLHFTKSRINLNRIREILRSAFNNIDDLKLPECKFDRCSIKLKYEKGDLNKLHDRMKTNHIFSWARTYKDTYQYTYIMEVM